MRVKAREGKGITLERRAMWGSVAWSMATVRSREMFREVCERSGSEWKAGRRSCDPRDSDWNVVLNSLQKVNADEVKTSWYIWSHMEI